VLYSGSDTSTTNGSHPRAHSHSLSPANPERRFSTAHKGREAGRV
jgi:hypothetical protein